MEAEHGAPSTRYEQIVSFTRSSSPPSSPVRKSRIRPAGRNTLIAGGVMAGGAVLLMILIKLIGGSSFAADILTFGLFGFLLVAIAYCASAFGSVFLSKRVRSGAVKWIAGAVLDKEKRYDEGIPVDYVLLELEDGRQVTLRTDVSTSDVARPGAVGWASINKSVLTRFVTGAPA